MFFFSKLISFVEKNVFPNSPHSVMFVKKRVHKYYNRIFTACLVMQGLPGPKN